MRAVEHLKQRWGVGPWRLFAILVVFTLTGLTVVRLKGPVIGLILPEDAPTWVDWVVYIVVLFPLYQIVLLVYAVLLGQFNFFWNKFAVIGRRIVGIKKSSR